MPANLWLSSSRQTRQKLKSSKYTKKKPNKTLNNNNNNNRNITWKHLAADLSSNFAFLGLDELGPHLNFCNFLLHTANPCCCSCCWSSTLSCCWCCCCCWSIPDLCFMSRAGGNRNLGSRKWATVANSKAYCIIISLCVCVCVCTAQSTCPMSQIHVCMCVCSFALKNGKIIGLCTEFSNEHFRNPCFKLYWIHLHPVEMGQRRASYAWHEDKKQGNITISLNI